MKKLLIGLLVLGSVSSFASTVQPKPKIETYLQELEDKRQGLIVAMALAVPAGFVAGGLTGGLGAIFVEAAEYGGQGGTGPAESNKPTITGAVVGGVIGVAALPLLAIEAQRIKKIHDFLSSSLGCSHDINNCENQDNDLLLKACKKYQAIHPEITLYDYATRVVTDVNAGKLLANTKKSNRWIFPEMSYSQMVQVLNH